MKFRQASSRKRAELLYKVGRAVIGVEYVHGWDSTWGFEHYRPPARCGLQSNPALRIAMLKTKVDWYPKMDHRSGAFSREPRGRIEESSRLRLPSRHEEGNSGKSHSEQYAT